SNGNFSVFQSGKIYFSEDFGDLLEDANNLKFKKKIIIFLKEKKIKPDIILTDSHRSYRTTALGRDLAKKYAAEHILIQHHLAHIFSAVGDKRISNGGYALPKDFFGIAIDGTGYGSDGRIWGGEIFKFESQNSKVKNIKRIGHLENQIMLGGELAVREPARMLIAILAKFLSKEEIYAHIKKYYSAQEFEILYNQSQQNFNCIETSSTGRILDAVSLLLGFCGNGRNYKHEPVYLLEKNSTKPFADLHPKLQITNYKSQTNSKLEIQNLKHYVLPTTPLFEYLIENLHKDSSRLAATAQLYIAEGLYKLICHSGLEPESNRKVSTPSSLFQENVIFLAGGIANNKIIYEYLLSTGAGASRAIPRGDAGLSFGQIVFYLSGH
ncbi:MAG: hypothetical protein U0944_03125, partial [Candidatus Moranbacteria bacterium]|nr:hypothetical protein [Candidatus Moranbacteria bacterium]